MRYIGNAFSLQMIPAGGNINVSPLNTLTIGSSDWQKILSGRESIVGHEDIAKVLGVSCNRTSVTLQPGDSLLVAQVTGGRLPVGCTQLPAECGIAFYMVYVEGNLKPNTVPFGKNSIYGSIMKAAEAVAEIVPDGKARAMEDIHGNFTAEVIGTGFHATLWDD